MTTKTEGWTANLGACVRPGGVFFRVWAPDARTLSVELERPGRGLDRVALRRTRDGYFEGTAEGARAGDDYRFRVDGKGPYPDPASRFQPYGVHGPSRVTDP